MLNFLSNPYVYGAPDKETLQDASDFALKRGLIEAEDGHKEVVGP